MRYQVQIDQEGQVIVAKLRSSKSNAPTHIKTRRLAHKFAKQTQQKFDKNFAELGRMFALDDGSSNPDLHAVMSSILEGIGVVLK